MIVAYGDLSQPRNDSDVLDEWCYLLKSPDHETLLLYFEKSALRQTISDLPANKTYSAQWYNTRTGEWIGMNDGRLQTDDSGQLKLPDFPSGGSKAEIDWAALLEGIN